MVWIPRWPRASMPCLVAGQDTGNGQDGHFQPRAGRTSQPNSLWTGLHAACALVPSPARFPLSRRTILVDASFWLDCWREGRTGFHRSEVMPLLEKHWPALEVPRGTRVLVPLAGKTLDMLWLAAQGLRVLGVELSPLAVQAFFAEHGLEPQRHASACGEHYVAGEIEVIQGNVFDLDAATLAGCMAIYDRAALIALPPAMRQQYVQSVYARLSPAPA